jgi:ribosomal protein S18 acetylase RimI-like enzyme
MNFTIRPFCPSDYEEVVRLWRESGLTIKRSDELGELEKLTAMTANHFLVAEEKDGRSDEPRIVGTVIGAFDGRRAWIYHLAVMSDARRNGVAGRLMSEIEDHLRANGATKMNLLVEPDHPAACEFYRAAGFREIPLIFFTKEL